MVLQYQLSACYAAGSLGGTLGRLINSARRLSRACRSGEQEQTGAKAAEAIEPAEVANLNQTLRMMADAWRSRWLSHKSFDRVERALDGLKQKALDSQGSGRLRRKRQWEYHLLAQLLDQLKAAEHSWV